MAVRRRVDPVSAALFDVPAYDGAIVSDLFGDERYFADVAAFWTMQTVAIEAEGQRLPRCGLVRGRRYANQRGVPHLGV